MPQKRIRAYWLLLLVLLYTLSLTLGIGETQARYDNTAGWDTMLQGVATGITSDCMVGRDDAPMTVLVGEISIELPTKLQFWLRSDGMGNPEGALSWKILEEEYIQYLRLEMSAGANSIENGTNIQLLDGFSMNFELTLTPTDNARNVAHEALLIPILVGWGDSMRGLFHVQLPASVPEGSLPEDGGDSDNGTDNETTGGTGNGTEGDTAGGSEEGTTGGTDNGAGDGTAGDTGTEDNTTGDTGTDPEDDTAGDTGTDPEDDTAGDTGTDPEDDTAGDTGTDPKDDTTGDTGTDPEDDTAGDTGTDTEDNTAGDTGDSNGDDTNGDAGPPEDGAPDDGQDSDETPISEDTGEAGDEEIIHDPLVKLDTVNSFDPSGLLPVKLTVGGYITTAQLGMTVMAGDGTSSGLEPFPQNTRFSVDGGKSYYLMYNGHVAQIDMEGVQTTTVLLDFSQVDLPQEETLYLYAEGRNEFGDLVSSCAASTVPNVTIAFPVGSYLLNPPEEEEEEENAEEAQEASQEEPEPAPEETGPQLNILTQHNYLEITFPEKWTEYRLDYTIELLTLDDAGSLAYIEAETFGEDNLLNGGLVAQYYNQLDANGKPMHKFVLRTGPKLPQAGTYRVNMNWSYQDICFATTQTTFFINYSACGQSAE